MERYFLGIDIGTFASRGILIDEGFRVTADASVPHGMDNPQPGWFEQDAEAVWWGDLCKLCRTLIKQSGIRPEQIACVGTSILGTDCLPVDEQCRPLRPPLPAVWPGDWWSPPLPDVPRTRPPVGGQRDPHLRRC